MRKAICSVLFLFHGICAVGQMQADTLLHEIYKKCSSIKNGHYLIEKKQKSFTTSDTIVSFEEVYFTNTSNTNLNPFSAKIINRTLRTTTYIDSLGNVMIYAENDSSIKERQMQNSNEYYDYLFRYFISTYNKNSLSLYQSNHSELHFTHDTAQITTLYNQSDNMGKITGSEKIYVPLKTAIPFRIETEVKWQNLVQYSSLTIQNLQINNDSFVKTIFFSPLNHPVRTQTKKNTKFSTVEITRPLKINDSFPDFTLPFTNGKLYHLYDDSSPFIILDFGYIGCAPCILLSNELKTIRKESTGKQLSIIGINPYDSVESIRIWEKKRELNYPTCINALKLTHSLGFRSYPKVYILNREKKIIKIIDGYNSEVRKEIVDCMAK